MQQYYIKGSNVSVENLPTPPMFNLKVSDSDSYF